MDAAELARLAALEQRHFWYAARRGLVTRLAGPGAGRIAIDVGAAAGGNTAALAAAGWRALAVEFSETGSLIAQQRGVPVLRADAQRLPIADARADLVVAFDVIEHLPDDVEALSEMRRVLKPGGRVAIAVPADPKLWSAHDDAVGHLRRYLRPELTNRIRAAGLEVDDVRSWNVLMRPVVRMRRQKATGSDLTRVAAPVNLVLRGVLELERVLPVGGLPGVSLIVTAHAG